MANILRNNDEVARMISSFKFEDLSIFLDQIKTKENYLCKILYYNTIR